MRIVIAPDSFKDCLTASDVSKYMEEGIKKALPHADIVKIPLADGGEGFTDTMLAASGGEKVFVKVLDPLGRDINAFYGILPDQTAVIEMAAASGIELLKRDERNPMVTSTHGTGQLIEHALDRKCKKIMIGIGGSATNDGGTGMAKALGFVFKNDQGNQIPEGGGGLSQLHSIDATGCDKRLQDTEILVACDVTNPLTGKTGASAIYGPQKGADEEMIQQLDQNLARLAAIIHRDLHTDVLSLAGGGAAGGLGAGLVAFAGGKLNRGFDMVKEQTGLEALIKSADIVFTGEGKIDGQTIHGKTPWGVAQITLKYKKPLIALAGVLGEGYRELYGEGFTSVFALANGPSTVEESIMNAPALLSEMSEKIMRMILFAK